MFALADRVLRPPDAGTAAAQLRRITSVRLPGITVTDRLLLRMGGGTALMAPGPVVWLATALLRRQTASLVFPSEPPARLAQSLQQMWDAGGRPNVNLLGEAVLGSAEAERRSAAFEAMLHRPDIDCVSVKVSSIAAGLSLVDFGGSLERISGPLQRLYRAAMATDPPKLVNLDMEEHRDLDLTVAAFTSVLDRPEFAGLTAGVALQAYLPDTHESLDHLLAWAESRRRAGKAPVRVRLVKGANLAMELVEAELRGWPSAPYRAKTDTDASYARLLERLIEAAGSGSIQVGAASHNLFDLALALVLADRQGVVVDVEMLAGMADAEARAVAERIGRVLLYAPITSRRDFRNALAYLARRLDENATPEGFLRQALSVVPGDRGWDEQADRFARSVRERAGVGTHRHQNQDRRTGIEATASGGSWRNEPDTDLTVPGNRAWALGVLRRPQRPAPPVAGVIDVDRAVARADTSVPAWSAVPTAERQAILDRAAQAIAAGRADAIGAMATEAGKTFEEADVEVSEAVDYARWYSRCAGSLAALSEQLESEPLGVVVVAPPWNFPYAIPAGGVLAALAAGNAVIVKPSPDAPATAALLVEQLARAGLGPDLLQLVAAPDDQAGQRLVTHPMVGGVVLTGSLDTARRFLRWAPRRRLLAETSGKNALVVGATADVDQAVADLVRSAFGHAGQKCSAASLAIVDGAILDKSQFLVQLADATSSLRVGPANDPSTQVGPLVGPMTPALDRALTRLDPGESWLVAPELLDAGLRLWRPGVRVGVRAGSWAHLNEWFGPVLGVMRCGGLQDAIGLQNAIPYGLTAGLHSLDPMEHRQWSSSVEAGNLYINRPTTGAIVGRQPFGGWKGSSLGPTAKTGGPNSLIGLRRWRDAAPIPVDDAIRSYREWWEGYFSAGEDVAGLQAESNILRYQPFRPGVVLRLGVDAQDDEALKAVGAAEVAGCPLLVSTPQHRTGLVGLARRGVGLVVESAEALAARLAAGPAVRVRLVGRPEEPVLIAAAERGLTVLDEPVCSHGRIELLRWVREQTVSRSLHRYGNIVYDR